MEDITTDGVSQEDFHSFVRVRDGGRYNMATNARAAAYAAGISLEKYLAIMLNFDELANRYGEYPRAAKVRTRREKPAARKTPAKFEPDPSPNCGYAEVSFVVQRRIPAVEKSRNWINLSIDLPSLDDALGFIEEQKKTRMMSNGPKRVFRVVRKAVSAEAVAEAAE